MHDCVQMGVVCLSPPEQDWRVLSSYLLLQRVIEQGTCIELLLNKRVPRVVKHEALAMRVSACRIERKVRRGQLGNPAICRYRLSGPECFTWIVDISYGAAHVDPEAFRSCIYGHIIHTLCSP